MNSLRLCCHNLRSSVALALIIFAGTSCKQFAHAADEKSWELSNYRVRVTLAFDATTRPFGWTGESLGDELHRRIRAAIYPLWTARVEVSSGTLRTKLLKKLDRLQTEELPERDKPLDKEIFLRIVTTSTGTEMSCREYDLFTQRWTETLHESVTQDRAAPRAAFGLICRTFGPLAVVRADMEDESQVTLLFKGEQLPRQTDEELFVSSGDVYQPLLVRLSRTLGEPPETIVDLPWTYLTVREQLDRDWQADVHTGTRSPFGTRRRGRIETMAVAVKRPAQESVVRFHATHDASLGLGGYEVFVQNPGETGYQPLGLTDSDGRIVVPHDNSPVRMLLLRSDGQLLAKVPVVAGRTEVQQIPIADDVARLLAQEELTVLKEKLIDVVARRNILIARIRAQLPTAPKKTIDEMLDQLNALPDRARFDRLLTDAQSLPAHKSQNPRVQQKIDKMFTDARSLLGQFLGVSNIMEIEAEVRQFRQQATAPPQSAGDEAQAAPPVTN